LSIIENERVLVAGTGGGADILTAKAFAACLEVFAPSQIQIANHKSKGCVAGLTPWRPHLYEVSYRPLRGLKRSRGTTRLEANILDANRPLVFHIDRQNNEANQELLESIASNFDIVITVDTGADSICAGDDPDQRDKRCLRLFQNLPGRIKWLHALVGPGADGETEVDELVSALDELDQNGKIIEKFSLCLLAPIFQKYSADVGKTRTINIILSALTAKAANKTNAMRINRGRKPTIPLDLLTSGFLLDLEERRGLKNTSWSPLGV
jgi:hypothetical protein